MKKLYTTDDFDISLFERFNNYLSKNGDSLLSSFPISDEELLILNDKAKKILSRCNSMNDESELIIILTLINFVINDYKLGHFWDEFKAFLSIEDIDNKTKIKIESFCNKYSLFFYKRENRGFKTTIMVHSILPNFLMDYFFDTLYDIYIKDLEEEYHDEEVKILLDYIEIFFKNNIKNDEVSVNYKNRKITLLNNKLPISFRTAYIEYPNEVKPIVERMLYYIDQLHYNNEIEYLQNDRFDKYFKSYIKKEPILKERKLRQKSETKKKFSIAKYSLNYRYSLPKLYLNLPQQLVDASLLNDDIYLTLYDDNVIIKSKILDVLQGKLSFKTEQLEIELEKFYPKLRYEIKTDDKVIYNSKNSLFRDFLIFNNEGNESNNFFLDESIHLLYLKSDEVIVSPNNTKSNNKEHCNYNITEILMEKDTEVLINNKYININDIKRNVCKNSNLENCAKLITSNKEYNIFTKPPEFNFIKPYNKSDCKIIVIINGENYRLDEIAITKSIEIADGSGDTIEEIKFKENIIEESKLYSFSFKFAGESYSIKDINFSVLTNFKIHFDKDIYINDFQAIIDNIDFNKNHITFEESFPITVDIKKVNFSEIMVDINNIKCTLRVNIPILVWKINDELPPKESILNLWYDNLKEDSLKVYGDLNYKIFIKQSNKTIFINNKSNRENTINLKNITADNNQQSITIAIESNNKHFNLLNIYFYPFIDNISIENSLCGKEGFFLSYDYIGHVDLIAELRNSKISQILKTFDLKNKSNVFDKSTKLVDGDYQLVFKTIKNSSFFGIKEDVVKTVHFKLIRNMIEYSKDNQRNNVTISEKKTKIYLEDRCIKINKCYCNNGKFYDISNLKLTNIKSDECDCIALFDYTPEIIQAIKNPCGRVGNSIKVRVDIKLSKYKNEIWGTIKFKDKPLLYNTASRIIMPYTSEHKYVKVNYVCLGSEKEFFICH